MFGVSFLEFAVIALVALVVVGPQKLPEMARTAGEWIGKLRRLTTDMRKQTGIDDILREEGIDGVAELRSLLRGEQRNLAARHNSRTYGYQAYAEAPDVAVEFPPEGPDAQGALPDDLLMESEPSTKSSTETTPTLTNPTLPSPAPDAAPPAALPLPRPARPSGPPRPPSSRPPSSRPPEAHSPATAAPSRLPQSFPPPPATPRRLPPRAVTLPETPVSKSEPKIVISEPPPPKPLGDSK